MKRGLAVVGTLWASVLLLNGTAFAATTAHTTAAGAAPAATGNFNLQVSPSPLVTTVKPGVKSSTELKIHNDGSGTEYLQVAPRKFTFDSATGKVNLEDTVPPVVNDWIAFSAQKFTVPSGQAFTETITLDIPQNAGFSYSFALVITRQNNPAPQGGTRAINGSLAVFALVNVDRPGAKSQLQVVSFTADKRLYEYLPATFSVRFNNTGNTIVQPSGSIFIQRSAGSKAPITTLAVNKTQAYILPGTERSVSSQWGDGFAVYTAAPQANGSSKHHLTVDWSKLKQFRIGRYTAKLVAVYSDGQHDVPIEGVVTFWVIPWRAILLAIAVIVALWLLLRWRNKRRTEKAVKRALAARDAAEKAVKDKEKAAKKTEEKQS